LNFPPRPEFQIKARSASLNIAILVRCNNLTFLAIFWLLLLMSGCSVSTPVAPVNSTQHPDPGLAGVPPVVAEDPAGLKISRLEQLWQARRTSSTDFPIGPGDVISITVPGLPDLSRGPADPASGAAGGSTVKVNPEGYIELPLVGQVHAAGLTEEQLRNELKLRLDKYMYNPEVDLAVQSYVSRQVSVSGEVRSPGMYTINRPNETVRDMIIKAGGTNDNAGSRLVLTPAPVRLSNSAANGSPVEPAANQLDEGSEARVSDTNPLSAPGVSGTTLSATYVIDLSKGQSNQRYLNIPVRPGDTIYVPASGSVTIIGWVYSPKTIAITPGLTLLTAVSQAGGPLFAADTHKIRILRQGPGHETTTLLVDLSDIKAAKSADVLVQANDVIDVPYSPAKIPGYALYYAAQGLVSFAPAALIVNGL
jgi:polysaccharide export outer membrane protein